MITNNSYADNLFIKCEYGNRNCSPSSYIGKYRINTTQRDLHLVVELCTMGHLNEKNW